MIYQTMIYQTTIYQAMLCQAMIYMVRERRLGRPARPVGEDARPPELLSSGLAVE
jgi:hypothetical protein